MCLRESAATHVLPVKVLDTHTSIQPRILSLYLQYLISFCLVSQLHPVGDPVYVEMVGKWSKCSMKELFSVSPPLNCLALSSCSRSLALGYNHGHAQYPLLGMQGLLLRSAGSSITFPLPSPWASCRFLCAWPLSSPKALWPIPFGLFLMSMAGMAVYDGATNWKGLLQQTHPREQLLPPQSWENRSAAHVYLVWTLVLPVSRPTFFICIPV